MVEEWFRYPVHMVWSVTNLCNAHCIHCSSSSGTCLPGELDQARALQLIDELADMGCIDLALSGGEPLLRADIEQIIEHAVHHHMQVGLGTNGWGLNLKRAKELRGLGLQRIQISLDGIGQTHDEVRGLKGLFNRVERAIDASLESGLQTHICFTPHKENVHHTEQVIEFALSKGVHLFNLSQFVPVGRGSQSMDLLPEQWRSLAMLWVNKREQLKGRMKFSSHLAQMALVDPTLACQEGFRGCQAGMAQGYISADGWVTPCVMLPVHLGNVHERPLKEIWDSSPVIQQLRDRSNLGGNCGQCGIREKCGGCRGVAYGLYHDYLADDTHCWLHSAPESADRITV
ncbi:radical SAM protein [Paenibacillus sp. IHBB 3054]|uniref:radical SAM protein n=1 Tax=Paenibacillus sp. IHBB 3054 TaxID=3425689 RepID=UPI003F6681E2